MMVDQQEIARYTCGFRARLAPSSILAYAEGLTNANGLSEVQWTVAEPQEPVLRLLGRQKNRLQVEIWSEPGGETDDHLYGLAIAAPDPAEGAKAFFDWRVTIFDALDAKLVVRSVQEEIRVTLDAQRDILELDGQGLTEISGDIGKLHQNLKVLSLSNNRLSKLPPEMSLLTNLTELDVSDNLLTELPARIGSLTRLERLSAEHNRLRELPPSIGELANLRDLLVNDNKLRSLPPEIGRLTKLRRLDVQQNRLTELPSEFVHLELYEWDFTRKRLPPRRTNGFLAYQNPWVHPPEETVRRGPKATRDFLSAHPRRVAADGAQPVYAVYVDDNQHRYEEEWKRRSLGAFANCSAAIAACQQLIDSYLATLGNRNAEELLDAYRRFGEDPWIRSDDKGCVFDAWSYAEQRCHELGSERA